MDGVTGVMIDMDGTVYKGSNVIQGAPEFIEQLRAKGIPFVFLTNNSASGRPYYLEKLKRMGFKVSMEEVLTSTTATIRFIMKEHPGRSVYPVGTQGFVDELTDAGMIITDKDPDIVLLSFDRSITYEKINKAYNFLIDRSEFIATHPDDLCPTENGYDIDIGPFIRMLESMTDKRATVIGKPNRLMIEMAADIMNVDPSGMVMIGDRLITDIKMAADNGIRSILVLTGEAEMSDIDRSGIYPDAIADSVIDIPCMLSK